MAKMVRMVKTDIVLQKIIGILFLGLIFFLPLIFWIPSSEVFELPKMLFVYLMAALITAVWAMRMILAGRIIWRRTPLDIPILLFLLSQIISTIYSIDPHISWFGWYGRFNGGLWSTISYTLLYYAFVCNHSPAEQGPALQDNHFSHLNFAILASAVIVSLYALFQHFGIDKNFWIQDVMNRVFSTQGQPNWLAAYFTMVLPLTWAIIIVKDEGQRTKAKGNIGVNSLSLIFFLALLWTKSRSGLLGFAVADVVFWLIVFAKKKSGVKSKELGKFLFIHAVIALLMLFTNNPARDFLRNSVLRPSSLSLKPLALSPTKSELGGTESGDIRKIVWNGATELVKQRPFFGFGPETFGLTYWQVRPKEANQTSEWNFLYNKAHNEWLNLAANTGLFGLGTHLLLVIWFTIWVLKGPALPQRQGRALLNYAILAGLLGVETINFFGFSTVTIETYRYLFMAMAVMTESKESRGAGSCSAGQKNNLPFTIYCLLFTVFLTTLYSIIQISRLYSADLSYNLGRQFSNAGYAADALKPLSKAVSLAPFEPVFRNELAETQAVLAISLSSEMFAQSSLANFKIISNQSKYNLTFVRTQAQMEFLMREIDPNLTGEALLLAQKVIDLSPTDPRGYYLLGRMYGELDDKSKAEKLYHQALELKPDYAEANVSLNSIK